MNYILKFNKRKIFVGVCFLYETYQSFNLMLYFRANLKQQINIKEYTNKEILL